MTVEMPLDRQTLPLGYPEIQKKRKKRTQANQLSFVTTDSTKTENADAICFRMACQWNDRITTTF